MQRPSVLFPPSVSRLIDLGLEEDLANGDVTTRATISPAVRGRVVVAAREALVVSGTEVAAEVFGRVDPGLEVVIARRDGTAAAPGDGILTVSGSMASILTGERLALNFMGRLCGVATHTRRFVEAIAGTNARIVDTRKSTPGLRWLEKNAVRHGGGANHRFNLSDGILIKDNHIAATGGITQAISAARANAPHHLLRIEVEVDSLDQLDEALACGVEVVLLDNMSLDQLREAVRRSAGRVLLEASGGVRLETVRAIAETGVDLISAGSLIHGARWVDLGLDVLEVEHARG